MKEVRKKVLVTGASGRVGRVLIPKLLERGYAVRALTHKVRLEKTVQKSVELVQGTLAKYKTILDAVDGVNMICHLASLMPPGQSREDLSTHDDFSIFDVNVKGTFNLLEASRHAKELKRFVFASTDATYPTGWSEKEYKAPIDEDQPQWPVLFYGLSKLLGEVACIHYWNIYKIPTVILRFSWIFSSQDVRDPQFILNLFAPKMWLDWMSREDQEKYKDKDVLVAVFEGDGSLYKEHVVDVRDVVQAILLSLEKDEAVGNIFNIAGPTSFYYEDQASFLAEAFGKPYVKVRCQNLYSYEFSIARARNFLGYNPQYDIKRMLKEAIAVKKEKLSQ